MFTYVYVVMFMLTCYINININVNINETNAKPVLESMASNESLINLDIGLRKFN